MRADVKLTKNDLFKFMFYHMYMRPTGLIYLIGGLVSLGGGIYFLTRGNTSGVFLILISAVYFVLQPVFLYFKASQQAKQEVLQRTTTYIFDDLGMHAYQGEQSNVLSFENMHRAAVFSGELIIYLTDIRANVIPLQLFSDREEVLNLLREKLPKKKRRGF